MYLFAKRLERSKFIRPPIVDGTLTLTPVQLALLIGAMDWRRTIAPPAPPLPLLPWRRDRGFAPER
jgi:transposase